MEDNKLFLVNEVKKNFNSAVITPDLIISRLIGLLETEEDFYYILSDKEGFSYHSTVGNLIYLNNKDDLDYESIDKSLTLNGLLKLPIPILKLL